MKLSGCSTWSLSLAACSCHENLNWVWICGKSLVKAWIKHEVVAKTIIKHEAAAKASLFITFSLKKIIRPEGPANKIILLRYCPKIFRPGPKSQALPLRISNGTCLSTLRLIRQRKYKQFRTKVGTILLELVLGIGNSNKRPNDLLLDTGVL